MKGIGIATSTLLVALAVGAAIIGYRSIPDAKRYLHMRGM